MKHWKALLTLILIIPFLTELMTYNMPVHIFFNPVTFLLLLVFYGLAVLIIRELSVRWKVGLIGIFIMGLGYGIYNEGIVAKTLFKTTTVPLTGAYGHYPLVLGLNWAFAIAILAWPFIIVCASSMFSGIPIPKN